MRKGNESAVNYRAQCSGKNLWHMIETSLANVTSIVLPSGVELNKSEIDSFYSTYEFTVNFERYAQPVIALLLSMLGIFGSLAVIVTMRRDRYRRRITFKTFMITMSISDLVYNTAAVMLSLITHFPALLFHRTPVVAYSNVILLVVASYFSMFSDMTSLWLSCERFVATNWPYYWHNKTNGQKRRYCYGAIGATMVVSWLRVYVAFKVSVYRTTGSTKPISGSQTAPSFYYLEISKYFRTPAYVILGVISDVLLPVFFATCLLYLTIRVACQIRRQRRVVKAAVMPDGSVDIPIQRLPEKTTGNKPPLRCENNENRNDLVSMSKMLLCTASATTVCQVFYACNWIFTAVVEKKFEVPEQFSCTDTSVVKQILYNSIMVLISEDTANFLELFVRTCQFYFYLLFSYGFRYEFLQSVNDISAWLSNRHFTRY